MGGGVAGLVTSFVTNPLDVVKTRLQTQHHHITINNKEVKTMYKDSWSAIKLMVKEEGYRSFTRGLAPRVVTSVLFSSWFGLVYEFVLEVSKK